MKAKGTPFWLLCGGVLIILVLMLGYISSWQEKLIFFPEVLPQDYAFPFSRPFKELFLRAPDGGRINAVHFKAEQPKGVVLYFHGNAGSLRTWGEVADEILPYGYDLFMIDYRGFGKSTGKLSEELLHQDALLAHRYLRLHYAEDQILLFGRSLGTGIAVRLAAATQPKALILETPYFNLLEVARLHYPYLPTSMILKYPFRSDLHIGQVKCPVLILHGTADMVVPHASGKKLAALLEDNVTFVTLQGGQHNGLSEYPAYKAAMAALLQ